MHRIRLSVRENRLVHSRVTEADYVPAIEGSGRGWVVEAHGRIVGFGTGNAANGSITILAGNATGTTRFTVTDDPAVEGNETVIFTMGTPSGGVAALGGGVDCKSFIPSGSRRQVHGGSPLGTCFAFLF